jgi:hypothetical protein
MSQTLHINALALGLVVQACFQRLPERRIIGKSAFHFHAFPSSSFSRTLRFAVPVA